MKPLLAAVLLSLPCAASAQTDGNDQPYAAPTSGGHFSVGLDAAQKANQEEYTPPAGDKPDPQPANRAVKTETELTKAAMGAVNAAGPKTLTGGAEDKYGNTIEGGIPGDALIRGKTRAWPGTEGAIPSNDNDHMPLGSGPTDRAKQLEDRDDNQVAGNPMDLIKPGADGPGDGAPRNAGPAGGGAIPRSAFVDDAVASNLERRAANAESSGNPARASLFNALAGRTDRAGAQAEQALRRNPNDREALDAMLLVKQAQGHSDEARALARRALAVDPKDRLAALVAGHEGLDKSEALQKKFGKLDLGKTAQTDGAGGGLQGLFGAPGQEQGPRRAGGLPPSGGGAVTGAEGRGFAAGQALAGAPGARGAAAEISPPLTPAQQLVVRAVRKHEIGDDQGAMLALTQAVDTDPKEAAAYVVRAEVDNSLRKFTETIVDATKAVELAPARPVLTARALRARAYAQLELKQWVQALADASAAVEQDPRSGLGYLYRALAEDKLGRGTAAADDVAQAVKLDPALTPLAKPLLSKYNLSEGGSGAPARRSWPLLGAFAAVSMALLGFGTRRLFRSGSRGLTTTAAQRLRESAPVP